MFKHFWLCFLTLFVAVDAVGAVPILLPLIEGLDRSRVRRVIIQSMITALAVALAFMFVGNAFFRFLGITVSDFLVAGGTLLFIISINNLLAGGGKSQLQIDTDSLGAVPIGVPLIVGPAVLATLLLLLPQYHPLGIGIALVLNILIAGVIFWFGWTFDRVLGKAGSKTVSKLASLILAAYGIMLIRRGLTETIHQIMQAAGS